MNKPAAEELRRGGILTATALLAAVAGSVIVLVREATLHSIDPASILRCVILFLLCGVVWIGVVWARRILVVFVAAKLLLILLNILTRPDPLSIVFALLLAVSLALLTTYRSVSVFLEAQRTSLVDVPEDGPADVKSVTRLPGRSLGDREDF